MHRAKKNIIGYISLVISIAAFSVAAFQAWETQQHDRATVRPLIRFTSVTDDREPNVGLLLENVGLGPAKVKSLTVYVNNTLMKDWDDALNHSDVSKTDEASEFEIEKNEILRIGEHEFLLSRSTKNKNDLKRFIDFVDHDIAVSVTYCSLDDECTTACSRNGACEAITTSRSDKG